MLQQTIIDKLTELAKTYEDRANRITENRTYQGWERIEESLESHTRATFSQMKSEATILHHCANDINLLLIEIEDSGIESQLKPKQYDFPAELGADAIWNDTSCISDNASTQQETPTNLPEEQRTEVNIEQRPTSIQDLLHSVLAGHISIDFGRAWLDMPRPKDHLVSRLQSLQTQAMDLNGIDENYNPFLVKYNRDDTILIMDKIATLHSFITGSELILRLHENTLSFYEIERQLKGFYHRPVNVLLPPNIPEDIDKPIYFSIAIPSKKIAFANVMNGIGNKLQNPFGKEFTLNSIMGRKNRCKYHAKDNIGYGYADGTIFIYSNHNEVVISRNKHTTRGLGDSTDKEIEKLYNYIKAKELTLQGEIRCNLASWKCVDFERAMEATVEEMDVVTVRTSGTRADVEQYYSTLKASPISDVIVAHFNIW